MWFYFDSLNSTNPIFSKQAQATFICGPKSIHIRCCAMRLQSERPCRISCHFYDIEIRGGKIKITMADNNITSLFRLRLHINLKIARQHPLRAASIFISANTVRCAWRHVFFCACGSLQGRIRFTHETDDNVNNSAKKTGFLQKSDLSIKTCTVS